MILITSPKKKLMLAKIYMINVFENEKVKRFS